MENPRINSLNSNGASQTGNRRSGNSVPNPSVSARPSSSSFSSPSVQASRQLGTAQTAARLQLGDVVRGEITDLSNGEITMTLENNTMIRGQISDSSRFSIGQTAAFRLDSLTTQGVLLEPVGNYTETELTLINKALQEANLPSTPYNQSAVKALMDNTMPISRESIQQLMQQAYDMKTDDMNTLALMNKLMMDITPDNVAQFSSYRHGTHQLLSQLQNFAGDIPALLSALSEHGSHEAVARFGETLLSMTLSPDSLQSTPTVLTLSSLPEETQAEILKLLSGTAMTDDTLQLLENGQLSLRDALSMIRDAAVDGTLQLPEGFPKEELIRILTLIDQTLNPSSTLSASEATDSYQALLSLQKLPSGGETGVNQTDDAPENQNTLQNNTATPEDGATPSAESEHRFAFAGKFLQSLQETARHSLGDTLQLLRGSTATPASPDRIPIETTIIDELCTRLATHNREFDLVGGILSPEARQEMVNLLKQLPISSNLLERMLSGEASAQEVLQIIRNVIPLSDPAIIHKLFQTDSFEQLFARSLQSSWSITPEQLQQKEQPDQFFQQLTKQMSQLERLIQSTLSGSDSEQLGQSAHDIQSNIAFMKTLSETFSYLQLPLKLPNQNTNSDLYVYTQKNRQRKNPEKLSVLLHLDLQHLGTLEIRLDKDKQDIQANFSLQDDASVQLLQKNAVMLEESLSQLGYYTQIQVSRKNDAPVTLDQFLNTQVNTHATDEMKRFSFDIRA